MKIKNISTNGDHYVTLETSFETRFNLDISRNYAFEILFKALSFPYTRVYLLNYHENGEPAYVIRYEDEKQTILENLVVKSEEEANKILLISRILLQ